MFLVWCAALVVVVVVVVAAAAAAEEEAATEATALYICNELILYRVLVSTVTMYYALDT